jgi:RNA polymerase sigma-70 factor (ECF subfamily)
MRVMQEPALRLAEPDDGDADAMQALAKAHFEEVWRLLRRLGLPEADADDAAQHVFTVACRRFATIDVGRERAFLYGCALNAAAKWRESQHQRVQPTSTGDLDSVDCADIDVPAIDELVERHKARALLDAILDGMPSELRTVFVLFEFEELTSHEIATLLGIPRGTAASRLRRAREDFAKRLSRVEKRLGIGETAQW